MPALKARQMAVSHIVDDAWCPGCGLHAAIHGEHRPDCTADPSPLLCEDCGAIRLPSERRSPPWRYDLNARTYHCPNHPKGTAR